MIIAEAVPEPPRNDLIAVVLHVETVCVYCGAKAVKLKFMWLMGAAAIEQDVGQSQGLPGSGSGLDPCGSLLFSRGNLTCIARLAVPTEMR